MKEEQIRKLVRQEIERERKIGMAYKVISMYADAERKDRCIEDRFAHWLTAEAGMEERMEAFRRYFYDTVFPGEPVPAEENHDEARSAYAEVKAI